MRNKRSRSKMRNRSGRFRTKTRNRYKTENRSRQKKRKKKRHNKKNKKKRKTSIRQGNNRPANIKDPIVARLGAAQSFLNRSFFSILRLFFILITSFLESVTTLLDLFSLNPVINHVLVTSIKRGPFF